MFCAAFELLLLGGPHCTQVKIGLAAFLAVEREQVVWAARCCFIWYSAGARACCFTCAPYGWSRWPWHLL